MNYKNIILCFGLFWLAGSHAPARNKAAIPELLQTEFEAVVPVTNGIASIQTNFPGLHELIYDIFDNFRRLYKKGGYLTEQRKRIVHDNLEKEINWLKSFFEYIKDQRGFLDHSSASFVLKAARGERMIDFIFSEPDQIHYILSKKPDLGVLFTETQSALKKIIPEDILESFKVFRDATNRLDSSTYTDFSHWEADFDTYNAFYDRFRVLPNHTALLLTRPNSINYIADNMRRLPDQKIYDLAQMVFLGLLISKEKNMEELSGISGLRERVGEIFDSASEIPGFSRSISDMIIDHSKHSPNVFQAKEKQFDDFMGKKGFVDSWVSRTEEEDIENILRDVFNGLT